MPRRFALLAAAACTIVPLAVLAERGPVAADVVTTTPDRVLDTRTGVGTAPGRLVPGRVLELRLDGVDPGAGTAVMLNLTAARASARGHVVAWACDDARPGTSVLNAEPGHASANAVVLPYRSAGLCFASSVALDLVVDLTGVTTGGDVRVGASHRVHDSRTGTPHRAGREYRIPLAGGPGVGTAAATALLNVTITRASEAGWAIVQACGATSSASTMNFGPREAVPHFTVSALGGGDVCVTTSTDAHVIVDAFGWASSASTVRAVTPVRMVDTRVGTGGVTGMLRDGDTIRLRVAGIAGIPNDAAGAILNVAAVRGAARGYVSIHPCGTASDETSTLNLWAGVRRANQVVLSLPADGELCVSTTIDDASGVHVLVDSVGYLVGDVSRPEPPPTPTPPPPIDRFPTLPAGATLPSGAQCAEWVRPAAEIRPQNAGPNANRGSRANANNRADWSGFDRVDGDFAGTTDEIIQWAACKWGIDEDIARAQLVKESYWFMSTIGDGGESYGIGQVRDTAHPSAFEFSVNAANSTAYNVDYTYASWRACMEGVYGWLNQFERGRDYAGDDVWGCVGLWFTGRWYWGDDDYLNAPGDSVKWHYQNRTWERDYFVAAG